MLIDIRRTRRRKALLHLLKLPIGKAARPDAIIVRLRQSPELVRRIAAAADITPQAVRLWRAVPIRRVAIVESITGIDRRQLRPDFSWEPAP